MFNAETTIINRIKAKNKNLIKSLKVSHVYLDGKYALLRCIDYTNGRIQLVKYKVDSDYGLRDSEGSTYENWNTC